MFLNHKYRFSSKESNCYRQFRDEWKVDTIRFFFCETSLLSFVEINDC